MALDLDALRPAQPLVEIGVKLVLRNVPHRSPFGVLPVVRVHQAAARPRQRRPHRADGQARLRRDLRIAQPRVPEQQDLPVARGQRVERFLHRGHLLVVLDGIVGGRRDRRLRDRIALEQRQVPLPPHGRAGLVPRQVGRDGEDPCPRLLGAVGQRADEHLLRQVLGALRVPDLAVQEAHDGSVGALVELLEIVRHRPPCPRRGSAGSGGRIAEDGQLPIPCTLAWSGLACRSRLPATGKDTSWMEPWFFGRPLEAEIGLGGPAVGPVPAVQGAGHPVVPEVAAGRDHLHLQRVVSRPIDLAEIRRAA